MSSLKLACCLLAMSGAAAVATTDPLSQLSVNAGRGPPKVSCTFANGSRTKSLPDEFFGFEPCVFASGMVLRANDTALGGAGAGAGAAVWGWAKPAEMVSVTIGSVAAGSATADAKGRWQLALQMTASAAPHTVAVHGSVAREAETQVVSVLENVLFGSVFLCSGQVRRACSALAAAAAAAAAGRRADPPPLTVQHGFRRLRARRARRRLRRLQPHGAGRRERALRRHPDDARGRDGPLVSTVPSAPSPTASLLCCYPFPCLCNWLTPSSLPLPLASPLSSPRFNSSDNSGKSVGGFSAVCYLTALQVHKDPCCEFLK